ncbi:cytochrome P450 [Arthrobacter sp. KNU-44]|uniref:cytochrome P450 n=1 Tax=Arthrobacter sp. KNU-44 TaxID=3450744 RepID=UPI003F425336
MKIERADHNAPHTEGPRFPQLRNDPMKPPSAYEQWREQAGVVPAALHSNQRAWVVLRHDAVREALEHPGISVDAQHPHYPKVRKGVTSRSNDTMLRHMDAPMHGKFRRMMAGQFTLKRVNELRPELQRIVSEAIDGIMAAGEPVDLHKEVSLVIPTKVICALLGVDYSYSADIQRLSAVTTSASASAEELAAAAGEMYTLLDAIITEQVNEPRDGLIGKLIRDHMGTGEIEHRQVLGQSFMIIVAGHETTANTISMGMLQLFEQPDIRKRVTKDLSLIPGMVEDMIRMHSLVDGTLSRVAKEDMVIGGQEVKDGDGVVVNISAPNFDPRYWENPYKLNIDRNDRNHVSFGAGAHSCLGQNLARAELYLVFEQLLTRIPTMRVADVHDAVQMQNDGFIYGVRRLMVEW